MGMFSCDFLIYRDLDIDKCLQLVKNYFFKNWEAFIPFIFNFFFLSDVVFNDYCKLYLI